MIKQYLLLMSLTVLCVYPSCKKSAPTPTPSPKPFNFGVYLLNDTFTIPSNDVVSFKAHIDLLSGSASNQTTTAQFKNLPANIKTSNDNYAVYTGSLMTATISAHNATEGVYPAQVTFSNATTGAKTYDFYLHVTAPIDRRQKMATYYYPSNGCATEQYISCQIEAVAVDPYKIRLIDRVSADGHTSIYDTMYGEVDCCSNVFSIPSQFVRGRSVEGSATFDDRYSTPIVILTRKFITDTMTYSCTMTLETK